MRRVFIGYPLSAFWLAKMNWTFSDMHFMKNGQDIKTASKFSERFYRSFEVKISIDLTPLVRFIFDLSILTLDEPSKATRSGQELFRWTNRTLFCFYRILYFLVNRNSTIWIRNGAKESLFWLLIGCLISQWDSIFEPKKGRLFMVWSRWIQILLFKK